ncbi:hypothetical protein R4J17_09715 [Brachyspira intermedia]|uniref:hypothetical protein n=1 Tax=Brachyspira intermedia TaxID=84377 RepID=UPI003006F0A4
MDKKVLSDAEKAMLVQKHQADKAKDSLVNNNMLLDKLEEESKEKHRKILEMKKETEKLMNNAGIDKSALENVVIDSKKSDRLRRMREARANIKTEQIIQEHNINLVELINDVDDWDSYIQRVYEYADKYDVDLETDPYQQLLTPEEYKSIIDEYHLKFGKVEWCAADYAVVGLSVLTAVLTDYFLVAVPPVNTVNGVKNQIYQGVEQKGSPITKFLLEQKNKVMNAKHGDNKILRMLKIYQGKLEQFAKVPFDPSTHSDVAGLNPRTHRLQSLGHDPIFGIIFGVRDIMTGKFTVIGRDSKVNVIDMTDKYAPEKNPFMALVKWFCHILSDIPTTKGIPVPGLSFLQCINAESPFSVGTSGVKLSFNDLARWMYVNGYTLDHFITMSIVPMIIELFIGTYYTVANFELLHKMEDYKRNEDVKLQSMLALAHTLTMGGNIAKMAFMSWNPTAFNFAECLQMVKTWMKLYKAERARDLKINKSLYLGWEELNASFM